MPFLPIFKPHPSCLILTCSSSVAFHFRISVSFLSWDPLLFKYQSILPAQEGRMCSSAQVMSASVATWPHAGSAVSIWSHCSGPPRSLNTIHLEVTRGTVSKGLHVFIRASKDQHRNNRSPQEHPCWTSPGGVQQLSLCSPNAGSPVSNWSGTDPTCLN